MVDVLLTLTADVCAMPGILTDDESAGADNRPGGYQERTGSKGFHGEPRAPLETSAKHRGRRCRPLPGPEERLISEPVHGETCIGYVVIERVRCLADNV